MQIAVVIVIITVALAYTVWRIRKAYIAASDPCAGCQGCPLKDIKRKNGENKGCKDKK